MFDPKDSKTFGYHLFFLPDRKLFNKLQNIVYSLAEKYQGVKFEPHLTLLARIPKADERGLMVKTQTLAGMMKPFEIALEAVDGEDAYFRALYYKTKFSDELKTYHQNALEVFGVEDVNIYFPHLSLYYGNIAKDFRDEMISSLFLPADMNFVADKVYLYRTEGEVKDWVRVGEFPIMN